MEDKTPNPYLDMPLAEERLAGYRHKKALVGMICRDEQELPTKAIGVIDSQGDRWTFVSNDRFNGWSARHPNGYPVLGCSSLAVMFAFGPIVVTDMLGVPDEAAEQAIETLDARNSLPVEGFDVGPNDNQ